MDVAGLTADIKGLLVQFIDLCTPFSEQYGSGDVKKDIMICFFGFSCLMLLLALRLVLKEKNADAACEEVLHEPDEFQMAIDELRGDVKKLIEHLRGDLSYIKHDLSEIRTELATLAYEEHVDDEPEEHEEFSYLQMEP